MGATIASGRRRLAGALATLGAACGGDAREAPARADTLAPTPASVPARASVPAHVALDGEGLRLVDAAGATRALAFGVPDTQALTAVAAVSGPPRSRDTNQDCGAGALDVVTFADGLSLLLQEGRFVGWSSANGTPRTMSGIGVGSTRAELESAHRVEIDSTTLGVEFMTGGLQGVLESERPTAPIIALWAGAACVVR